ncbi:MAG: exo-alpha-sialidase [Pirellulales bacterium]|nr:exo-alpha-sialidase [Pirellulales bacterium]
MKTVISCLLASVLMIAYAAASDPRNFDTGLLIPDESYCDQPYIVVAKNGEWVCTMTTGRGRESQPGQHVVATISKDQGHTWSELVDIEPPGRIESSWAVPLMVPSGRIYAFYNYNGDNIRKLRGKSIKIPTLLGWYVYKFSDDNGRTWSKRRYRLPIPVTAVDRRNDWHSSVQLFWCIDKPTIMGGDVIFAFTRMGKYIHDLGEGWFFRSDNILIEANPENICWRLLPVTERGVRSEEMGSIQEEHNVVPLNNGDLFCVYRTSKGYAGGSYSRDGARTWTKPMPVTYTPIGRKIKTPRACTKIWRATNGKYLMWIHNTALQLHSKIWPMTGRDLAWLVGGIERDGMIHWSQPELVCYVSPRRGVSYPDLIEVEDRYFISATNKREARLIELSRALVEGLWRQSGPYAVTQSGIVMSRKGAPDGPSIIPMPRLPKLSSGGAFTLDLWFRLNDLSAGQVLLDSRSPSGAGLAVTTAAEGTVQLELSDGRTSVTWASDPGLLTTGERHHAVFIVDGGPKTISIVIDGRLCDGGNDPSRPFGVGRFLTTPGKNRRAEVVELGDVSGSEQLRILPVLKGHIENLRIYDRYLLTSEAVGNYRVSCSDSQ